MKLETEPCSLCPRLVYLDYRHPRVGSQQLECRI